MFDRYSITQINKFPIQFDCKMKIFNGFAISFLTIFASIWRSTSCECSDDFSEVNCGRNVLCFDDISIANIDDYRCERNEIRECNNNNPLGPNTIIDYNGYCFYTLHVVFRKMDLILYPMFYDYDSPEDSRILTMIVSLDLSKNNYVDLPNFRTMINLIKLDVSHNSLTVARFSNKNKLQSLNEIDFSYNHIKEFVNNDNDVFIFDVLKKLNLSNNNIDNLPPAVFDGLVNLEVLDLSFNYISALSPMTFDGVNKLINLNISNNSISEINTSLFRFNKLQELDLSCNKIKKIQARDIGELISLKNFKLQSNEIGNIEKSVFINMSSLDTLDLSDNMLENIDKDIFKSTDNLDKIDFTKNKLTSLPKELFKGKNISFFSIKNNILQNSLEKGMFQGLKRITTLDLSSQRLSSINDYAFIGLENLETLLLQHNNIGIVTNNSFRTLQKLTLLDLSFNKITNLNFNKDDFIHLRILILSHNNLLEIKHEQFSGLQVLINLDLSNNYIAHLEPNSFSSLEDLTVLELFNNPLVGTLENRTFNGLNSLPKLDICCTKLTSVKNNSFNGMALLKKINISHSNVNELEFNAFSQTGEIETIDLSHNQLGDFNVNTSDLTNLIYLILSDNNLKFISSWTFKGLTRLTNIDLSRNQINCVQDETFYSQTNLIYLDLSYNLNLTFNISIVERSPALCYLYLSNIHDFLNFDSTKSAGSNLYQLEISHAHIYNIVLLNLTCFEHLGSLVLSNNNVKKLGSDAFSNLTSLRTLDLSFNKITTIEPGTFKENNVLYSLNISHNFLSSVSVGIFQGLVNLHTIDISYNNINDLRSERFYDVNSLKVLIADHNKIDYIGTEGFGNLDIISIGDNPLPCEILVNLLKENARNAERRFTAIKKDYKRENIQGITCNMNGFNYGNTVSRGRNGSNEKVLSDIKDILLNYVNRNEVNERMNDENNEFEKLNNVFSNIEKSSSDNNIKVSYLTNLSLAIANANNKTNMILDKILNVITSINTVRRSPLIVPKDNNSINNLLPYMNKLKQDLEDTVAIEKNNIINEVNNKLASINKQMDSFTNILPSTTNNDSKYESKSLFTEICVGLILAILVVFVSYKLYKSRSFKRQRHSISTQGISNNTESLDL